VIPSEKKSAIRINGLKIFIKKIIGNEKNIKIDSELPLDIIIGPISQKIRKNIVCITVTKSSCVSLYKKTFVTTKVINAVAAMFDILFPIRTIPIASSSSSRIFKLLLAALLPFLLKVSIAILREEIIAVSIHEKKADDKAKNIIINW